MGKKKTGNKKKPIIGTAWNWNGTIHLQIIIWHIAFISKNDMRKRKNCWNFVWKRNWIYPVQRIIMCGFCLQWAMEQPHVPLSNPEHIRFLNRWSSGQKRRKIGNQLFYQQNQQSKPKQGCKRNPLKKQNSFPVNGYWKKN